VISKPVITSFTVEADVHDQPPVNLHPPGIRNGPRLMVVDRLKLVLERFGPQRVWGAREVWLYGQVPGESYRDVLCWREMTRMGVEPQPVQDSPSLPDWVREFVQERIAWRNPL
jgi:hypothetical protein